MRVYMGKWSKEELQVLFNGIEYPRIERCKKHPFSEVIFLTLYAVLVDIESWRAIKIVENERIDFLRYFFEYKNGTPSH